MELNQNVLNQIISDLDKSIKLHTDGVSEDFHPNCICGTPEVTGKCYHCQMKEIVNDLDCLITNLKPLAKNTINHVQFVDAESFRYALESDGSIKQVKCYPIYNDGDLELDSIPEPQSIAIDAITSRYAMDGNGSHVGYETVTFQWKAINKRQLGITGLPYLLSSWAINPNQYKIIEKDLPENEFPDPLLGHDDNCEFKGQSFDNCDCADFWEGYYQPEDDFHYQEMESILSLIKYPEAEFDADEREWQLGDVSFNLNEFDASIEYNTSCQQDNGMPFID
jgi:hypothetical protein